MNQLTATIVENMYGKYSVPDGLMHRPAVRLVSNGKVYEPKTIAFMRNMAADGDIIHAGTFFGDFLPGLSAKMTEGKKIWAFEPNPNSYENAAQTITLNNLENVTLQNCAVSNQNSEILFRTHDALGQPMGGHSHFVTEKSDGVVSVQAVRIDESVPLDRPVSILQLDIEGHEQAALRGARGIINKWGPILILEGFRRQRWIRNKFPDWQYRFVGELHGNQVYATKDIDIDAYA